MEIKTLKDFVTEHGTLTAAAEVIGVSKQNLSYALNKVKGETYVLDGRKLLREVPLKKGR